MSTYCGVSIQIIKKVYGHHIKGGEDRIKASSRQFGRTVPVSQQKPMQGA